MIHMRSNKLLAGTIIALITTIPLMISGCISGTPDTTPTPEPQASAMVATASPSIGPATIGSIRSSQVVISDIKVSFERDTEDQTETFSVLFTNNGNTPAKNTVVALSVSDAQTGDFYFGDQYNVGEIPPKSSKLVNLTTDAHDYTFAVQVELDYYWGDNLDFKNTYARAYTLVNLQ